jgi:hypothetical protein
LGKFWRALDRKMLIYFMPIWNILQTFGTFCVQLVHFFPVLVSCTKKNLATLPETIFLENEELKQITHSSVPVLYIHMYRPGYKRMLLKKKYKKLHPFLLITKLRLKPFSRKMNNWNKL